MSLHKWGSVEWVYCSIGDRQQRGCHSLSIYDCILKRARCLEMKGTLSAGGPHRPPWSPQLGWLWLAFSLKAAPINCEGESYISLLPMWPHWKLQVSLRSFYRPTPPWFHFLNSLFFLRIKSGFAYINAYAHGGFFLSFFLSICIPSIAPFEWL